LLFSNFIPIPLEKTLENKLIPAISWKNIKQEDISPELFTKWEVVGIALKTGKEANLLVLDIDDIEKFKQFYNLSKEETGYIVRSKTPGHFHVGFLYDPDFSVNKDFRKEAGFELKVNSLINFYSIDPEIQYKHVKLEKLTPLPKELKKKIKALIIAKNESRLAVEDQHSKNIDINQIIEICSQVYQKGQRQFWTIYTAGLLRKLGFSLEETKEALEDFLRKQNDDELEMRLAGIEHTFKEPLENVKGLSGLVDELGLSEKSYLMLRSLITKEKTQSNIDFSLYDILTLKVKEPSWIIPNLLPEGFSILGGKPKTGKSWLALQIALTCIQLKKRVVYFTLEDTPGRLQRRLKHLGITDPETFKDLPILFSFELPSIGKGAIKKIKAYIYEFKPDLIIIDPWVKIKPRAKGKDIFYEEYQSLDVLKEFTKEGVSILLVHHARKTQSEDPIDEILGSTGQTAVVDNILVLKRARGSQTAVLHLILRDFEETDLGLRFENGWRLEGSAKEVMLAEEQKKIIEAIKELGEEATPKAIADLLGKNHGTVRVILSRMVQKGIIKKTSKGTYIPLCNEKNEKNVNDVNIVNNVNDVNSVNTPPLFTSVGGCKQRCKQLEALSNLTYGETVYTVYTVYNKEQKKDNQDPTTQDDETLFVIDKPCVNCQCQIWIVSKHVVGRYGVGTCYNCKHQELSKWNKKLIISEEEAKRLSSSKDEDLPF
jgi:predicted transcriptional regulator